MNGFEIGGLIFAFLLTLLAIRVPIGVAMLTAGATGYIYLNGLEPLLNYLKTAAYWRFTTYDLSVIPLFLLMGQFASKAGMSKALFKAASVWLGHFRGGVAMAAVGGCAGFGAICGSSLATGATMGQVALPELRRYKYSGALSTGALAAGGTLGILIPPSVVLVIYAILTEGNMVAMFAAAFIPGILAALGYMAAIAVYVRLKPDAGPAGPKSNFSERIAALKDIWSVVTIFSIVLGGIYIGVFTPTEGAAVGAFSTAILAFTHGKMRIKGFLDCIYGTASATAMIFLILFGADIFNVFLALTQIPTELADIISSSGMSPYLVLVVFIIIYLIMGCFMDTISMILLTIPVFWPVISELDFGMEGEELKIWFGIIALVVVEVGLITPPVGMNVFLINSMAKDVPLTESFKGVVPFLASDVVRVAILILFPSISLFLPRMLN
ncbi:MAG: TRAP transporter large permease [Alphaproteobacteria bacterium]|nr:TRAP transporter large permease [Rhodospirillales bacterium]MCW9044948.1 TRAP transporter large permease [Alphaproteobacteria bacterium]